MANIINDIPTITLKDGISIPIVSEPSTILRGSSLLILLLPPLSLPKVPEK